MVKVKASKSAENLVDESSFNHPMVKVKDWMTPFFSHVTSFNHPMVKVKGQLQYYNLHQLIEFQPPYGES